MNHIIIRPDDPQFPYEDIGYLNNQADPVEHKVRAWEKFVFWNNLRYQEDDDE